jgi:hypothetical protein
MKLRKLLIVGWLLLGLASAGQARLIEGRLPVDPLLQSLVSFLDAHGIDVRSDRGTGQIGSRPEITNLLNFPIDDPGQPIAFEAAFGAGGEPYLLATGPTGQANPSQPADESLFWQRWNSAAETNRIFVSFSGKDLPFAKAFADGLSEQGYSVFLYKSEEGSSPRFTPREVENFFRQAGRHYVIDSANARASLAVRAEARLLFQLKLQARGARGRDGPLDELLKDRLDTEADRTRRAGER